MKHFLLLMTTFFIFSFSANAAVTINSLVATQSVTTTNLSFYINPGCGNGALITYQYSTSPAFTAATTITASYMNYGTGGTRTFDISGLMPSTTYYWRVSGSNTCTSTTTSVNGNTFTTLITDKPVFTTVIATTPLNYSGTIGYGLWANGFSTTSVINYGLSSASLTTQVTGVSTTTSATGSIPITSLLNNTTYFYQVVATNSLGTTSSAINSFKTKNVQPPTVSLNNLSLGHNFASIDYRIANNMGGNVTSLVRYGNSATNLNNQITGYAGNATFNWSNHAVNLISLAPNTTYFYQIECTNSSATAQTTIASFTTNARPTSATTSGLLAHYAFENNTNSHNNMHNLTNAYASGPTYVAGVNGLCASFTGSNTLINNTIDAVLNTGEYSVAFWEKRTGLPTNYPTSYEFFSSNYFRGTTAGSVGMFMSSTAAGGGWVALPTTTLTTYESNWVHYAVVFKTSGTQKVYEIYINGVHVNPFTISGGMITIDNRLSGSTASTVLSKFNNKFAIAGGTTAAGLPDDSKIFQGQIDEFYLYNRAITETEIVNIKNSAATLSSQNFNNKNLKASIYPNPATDILNIEIANEIKIIEIYSLLGQKIMTENQKKINVSGLSKGIYIVKIEDDNDAIARQKLIIK